MMATTKLVQIKKKLGIIFDFLPVCGIWVFFTYTGTCACKRIGCSKGYFNAGELVFRRGFIPQKKISTTTQKCGIIGTTW